MTDIVALIDGRPELPSELDRAPTAVRTYVVSEFGRFLADPGFAESLAGHLPGDDASQRRAPLIVQRMRTIAERT